MGESPLFYCTRVDLMSLMAKEELVEKISEIAERVASSEGIEIVDVELLGAGRARLLRIYIDRPNAANPDEPHGVSHADCEFISQQVGTILDIEDVIPGDSYTLEVSSPGLERKLSKPKDFERFVGQKAKVVLREPVENQRRWEGKLAGFSQGVVALEVSVLGPTQGRVIHFPLAQVQKANLKFDW
ncbi:MAG TPA: ribosome maturation factor RimP [Bryobacteraceae bacterium]|nr:ribosome maturation factor RimP [Bryobacteraceae bacterium]